MNFQPFRTMLVCVISWMILSCVGQSLDTDSDSQKTEFFEKEIRPLLVQHCYACHSPTEKGWKAGLRLDSRQAMLQGGESGPALQPGQPDESLLIQAIRYETFEMPPHGKLPEQQIRQFERWVQMGAPWPAGDSAPSSDWESGREKAVHAMDLQQRKNSHWAWQPITEPNLPQVRNTNWPQQEIDYFLLASLEQQGLPCSEDADRYALVRRLYFDLTGLPPSPEQIQSFVSNSDPKAFQQLVDRLLDSPHFGERWGRHWLDLVRFAESRGHEFDNDAPYAFQYRDYVIRGLNADVPYDQWIREHLAGDLLPSPRVNPGNGFNESILGTGFWFLGEWVHSPVDIRKDEADRFDNMIDVMSKALMGLTISCARCHDHKFDAITSEDYYALSGFLQGSDYREVPFETMEQHGLVAQQLHQIDESYRRQLSSLLQNVAPDVYQSLTRVHADFQSKRSTRFRDALFLDFADQSSIVQDGFIFGSHPTSLGALRLDENATPSMSLSDFSAASSDPFWNPLTSQEAKSTSQKSKLHGLQRPGRTLRTPTHTLRSGRVDVRLRGAGHVVVCVDSHRLVAGPLHDETVKKIPASEDFQWVSLDLKRYVGHRLHFEFTPESNSRLDVRLLLQGADDEIRTEVVQIESQSELAIQELEVALDSAFRSKTVETQKRDQLLQQWLQDRKSLQSQVRPTSKLAMAMWDGDGEDDAILIRGNASNPGRTVARRFLAAIDGNAPMAIRKGSGRLELADRINDPENPFTHRVIVNRIWHWLMGRGIVPTNDDFGVSGQPPSHPELLDHLAIRFRKDGQSIKKLIRYIVLSRAYQMSNRANSIALEKDPNNRLWHSFLPKRLEGEAIRDALLMVSGRLDSTMHGASIPVHLTAFMDGRGRPDKSGPLDGLGRRSIYLEVRRNFLSPFFLAFDTPVPFSTMGRRNTSNVPAQALILMNDPLVAELADLFAKRALQETSSDRSLSDQESAAERIQWMYLWLFARQADQSEMASALDFLKASTQDPLEESSNQTAWSELAHALINTKEFVFLR